MSIVIREKNKQQRASRETWSPNFSKALHWPSKYNNGEYESECWKPFPPNSIKRKKFHKEKVLNRQSFNTGYAFDINKDGKKLYVIEKSIKTFEFEP